LIAKNLLNPSSKEYFERTRAQDKGMPLEQFQKEKGGEEAWVEVTPALKELGDVLRKLEGPFVMGFTTSYSDFVIVSSLHMLSRIDQKIFDRIVGIEPKLGEVYNACKPWLERDDH